MDHVQRLRKIVSWMEECPKEEVSYAIDKLEEYRKALFSYAKFKVGDFVKLAITPNINDKENWGWIGYKDYLVKDAVGVVEDVDYYKGYFRYGLIFKNIGGGTFTFYENCLDKANL